ncbi:uncharacterized protein C8Q71DRAFT_780396 [Rhodofomes roseus]|uniref:Secreted protein n=1 Tax=Rhodofomes roseus TaxID=34475 RepID=A0ABQ8K5K3_9APHY|nr:uncharacterized protein C8Q71DRAFT_780396 [Rhodofomes roseus]KAH9831794.1 hypothetical protein C8Q71DRAFT_780396 [Rhodofomes roseus]
MTILSVLVFVAQGQIRLGAHLCTTTPSMQGYTEPTEIPAPYVFGIQVPTYLHVIPSLKNRTVYRWRYSGLVEGGYDSRSSGLHLRGTRTYACLDVGFVR